jgi:hypothetical protein
MLVDLQIAVINQDKDAVQALINEIDRRTENEMFRRAGEHFGFKTVEAYGRRIANRADLCPIFGYADESGLRKITERYDLETYKLTAYGQDFRRLLAEELGLSKYNNKATFVSWSVFLMAGIESTTKEAEQIKLYLLKSERAGRIASGAVDIIKTQDRKIERASKVVSMICRADRIADKNLRQRTLEHIDDVLDGALKIPKQSEIFQAEA